MMRTREHGFSVWKLLALGVFAVGLVSAWGLRGYLGAAVFQADIPYAENGHPALRLDLARPRYGTGPFPAVVAIHGGGWSMGNRRSYTSLIRYLAARGYVAVSIDYRLTPKHIFPAQIEDVRCAVRWLRGNAEELDIDPDRIAAMGSSAGAHLALMLGVLGSDDGLDGDLCPRGTSSRVQAVVSFFAPTDLTLPPPEESRRTLDAFLGGPLEEHLELARRASPVSYLDMGDAPILAFHGTADDIVPYRHAERLQETARGAGVPTTLVTLPGKGHGWTGLALAKSMARSIDFLDAELGR